MQTVNYWHDQIGEEDARRILGPTYFDYAVSQGAGFCAAHRQGSWDASHAEYFAAYDCAARVAGGEQGLPA